MIITLIGMSNLGKSHWADRLADECGFERIDCDKMVEAKLAPLLQGRGFSGLRESATWMGFPFEPQYSLHSRESLKCEREVMLEIIHTVGSAEQDRPVVIDTCGSVVYAGEDVLLSLKNLTTVVYLEASLQHRQQLFERYLSEPKPVIWGDDSFLPNPGETSRDALTRCYPILLQTRAERYAALADITIPFERHRDPQACALDIFPGLNVGLNLDALGERGVDSRRGGMRGIQRS